MRTRSPMLTRSPMQTRSPMRRGNVNEFLASFHRAADRRTQQDQALRSASRLKYERYAAENGEVSCQHIHRFTLDERRVWNLHVACKCFHKKRSCVDVFGSPFADVEYDG